MLPAALSKFYLTNEDHATDGRREQKSSLPSLCQSGGTEREETVTCHHMKNVVGIFYHLGNVESLSWRLTPCGPGADKHNLIDLTVHYLNLI